MHCRPLSHFFTNRQACLRTNSPKRWTLFVSALGAETIRLLIVDYALASLQELGEDGPTGARLSIEGTLAGRAFARDEVVVAREDPPLIWAPVAEGGDRFGVLEITHTSWGDAQQSLLPTLVRILALVLISKRRYSDVVPRSRRTKPLSLAAEIQWDLLPPLTYETSRVSVSGILEPAYSIGGDSFDFAFNADRLEFAIFDAVGRGMAAVLMSVAAVNSLRNARRTGHDLDTTYYATNQTVADQFGDSAFVTAQFGSLAIETGDLTWLNAGHPPPLLVRDGKFAGELGLSAFIADGARWLGRGDRDRETSARRSCAVLHGRRQRSPIAGWRGIRRRAPRRSSRAAPAPISCRRPRPFDACPNPSGNTTAPPCATMRRCC